MFLILTLIILVAAFNVDLLADHDGEGQDARTSRCCAPSAPARGAIMRIFLMCGAFVGVTGTLVGTLLGVLFCLNIETIQHWLESGHRHQRVQPRSLLPQRICRRVLQWQEVGQVVAMALVLSLLATLYPSWRAARTDPVEALRHE